MRLKHAAIALLLLPALAISEVALPVRFANDIFSARFPSVVKESTSKITSGTTLHTYTTVAGNGDYYYIGYVDYDPPFKRNSLDAILDGSLRNAYSLVISDVRADSSLDGLNARYMLASGIVKSDGVKHYVSETVAWQRERLWILIFVSERPPLERDYTKFAKSLSIKQDSKQ